MNKRLVTISVVTTCVIYGLAFWRGFAWRSQFPDGVSELNSQPGFFVGFTLVLVPAAAGMLLVSGITWLLSYLVRSPANRLDAINISKLCGVTGASSLVGLIAAFACRYV